MSVSKSVFLLQAALVFENTNLSLVDENTIRNPSSFYGKTKLMGEYFCESLYEKGIEAHSGILFNANQFIGRKIFFSLR